jgi:hypothetical protein
MLNIRKEIFIRRKKFETGGGSDENEDIDLNSFNLLPFKKELF